MDNKEMMPLAILALLALVAIVALAVLVLGGRQGTVGTASYAADDENTAGMMKMVDEGKCSSQYCCQTRGGPSSCGEAGCKWDSELGCNY